MSKCKIWPNKIAEMMRYLAAGIDRLGGPQSYQTLSIRNGRCLRNHPRWPCNITYRDAWLYIDVGVLSFAMNDTSKE